MGEGSMIGVPPSARSPEGEFILSRKDWEDAEPAIPDVERQARTFHPRIEQGRSSRPLNRIEMPCSQHGYAPPDRKSVV